MTKKPREKRRPVISTRFGNQAGIIATANRTWMCKGVKGRKVDTFFAEACYWARELFSESAQSMLTSGLHCFNDRKVKRFQRLQGTILLLLRKLKAGFLALFRQRR